MRSPEIMINKSFIIPYSSELAHAACIICAANLRNEYISINCAVASHD